jgi:hypothetical protein
MPAAQLTTLAPVQGEPAKDDRPPERQPGTPEHLGENPYQGAPSPFVEGEAQPAASTSTKKSSSSS